MTRRAPLEQEDDEDDPGDDIPGQGESRPQGDPLVVEDDIEGAQPRESGQEIIDQGDAVGDGQPGEISLRMLDGGIEQENKGQGKGEMDGPDLGGIKHDETGQAQLEKGPAHGEPGHQEVFVSAQGPDVPGLRPEQFQGIVWIIETAHGKWQKK